MERRFFRGAIGGGQATVKRDGSVRTSVARRATSLCVAGVLASTSAACTAAFYQVKAPPPPIEATEKAQPTALPGPYLLQVDDLLTVRFYRNPELDQDVRVRPDGMISLPYVDEVRAAGLSPAMLDDQLTRMYTGELATPDVTVIVVEFGGQRIYVGGQVNSQGVLDLRGGLTLFQAITAAGGFNRLARRDQVVLIRRDARGKVVGWAVDTRQIANGKRPELDMRLEPYDIVHVPSSAIANVNLWIDQYIRENLPINPSTLANSLI